MLEEFYQLKDPKSVAFSKKITPTKIPFLGIKIPLIKTFVKNHDITYDLLDQIPLNQYVEQDVLYGMFLNKLGKIKDEKYYHYLINFTKKLDNWLTCDTFVCNTNFKKNEYQTLLTIIQYLLKQDDMMVRCGIIFLNKYFVKVLPYEEILSMLKDIQYGNYYIDMGCAWLICTMASYNFDLLYAHLNEIKEMSLSVYQKAISKMKDSYRITSEQKLSI